MQGARPCWPSSIARVLSDFFASSPVTALICSVFREYHSSPLPSFNFPTGITCKMAGPKTPQKQHEFLQFLVGLNSRWDLDLPVLEEPESPLKSGTADPQASRFVARTKYLFYKDRVALHAAVGKFEVLAQQICSSSISETAAIPNPLPQWSSKKSIHRKDNLAASSDLSPKQQSQLKEVFLQVINEAHDDARSRTAQAAPAPRPFAPAVLANSVKDPAPASKAPQEVSPSRSRGTMRRDNSSVPAKTKQQASILGFLRVNPGDESVLPETTRITPQPDHIATQASENFGSDTIDEDLMSFDARYGKDLDPEERRTPPLQIATDPPSDEAFRTPPEISSGSQFFDVKEDIVVVPRVTGTVSGGLKRPSVDQLSAPGSRKVSRSSLEQQSKTFGVRQWIPQDLSDCIPLLTDIKSASRGSRGMSSSTTMNNSFVSDARSSQATLGGTVTADTSFESADGKTVANMVPPTRKRTFGRAQTSARIEAKTVEPTATFAGAEMERSNSDPGSSQVNAVAVQDLDDLRNFIEGQLISRSPFRAYETRSLRIRADVCSETSHMASGASEFDFRIQYEVLRLSLDSELPRDIFFKALKDKKVSVDCEDYNTVWNVLYECLLKSGKKIPHKSSLNAWENAYGKFKQVRLSGALELNTDKGKPLFSLRLRPLVTDASNRITRAWGSDRLIYIEIPVLKRENLPGPLKEQVEQARELIIEWLVQSHSLLGRCWQPFFVRPVDTPRGRKKDINRKPSPPFRLYLFGFDAPNRITDPTVPRNLKALLDWIMNPSANLDQQTLKLFMRTQLDI